MMRALLALALVAVCLHIAYAQTSWCSGTMGCHGVGASHPAPDHTVPNLAHTPGVARTDLTEDDICSTKWGRDARHVTEAMKREVFASYGLDGNKGVSWCHRKGSRVFEIDHCISRELGGADDVLNLWPQCYSGKWNATQKDRLENRLHKEVCAGNLDLAQAQHEICGDWRRVYRRYFGNPYRR